jgi:hypothetical protein
MIIQPKDLQPQPISAILARSWIIGKRMWVSHFPFLFLIVSVLFWAQFFLAEWLRFKQVHGFVVYLVTTPVNDMLLSFYFAYVVLLMKRWETNVDGIAHLHAFQSALKMAPVLIVASLASYLLTLFGTILLVIPGVLFFLWLYLYPQVMAFEREGAIPSLKRSMYLVKGSTLHTLFVMLPFLALRLFLQFLPGFVLPETDGHPAVAFGLFIIREMILLPFEASAYYLLYLELRARKEAFDYDVYLEQCKA